MVQIKLFGYDRQMLLQLFLPEELQEFQLFAQHHVKRRPSATV